MLQEIAQNGSCRFALLTCNKAWIGKQFPAGVARFFMMKNGAEKERTNRLYEVTVLSFLNMLSCSAAYTQRAEWRSIWGMSDKNGF